MRRTSELAGVASEGRRAYGRPEGVRVAMLAGLCVVLLVIVAARGGQARDIVLVGVGALGAAALWTGSRHWYGGVARLLRVSGLIVEVGALLFGAGWAGVVLVALGWRSLRRDDSGQPDTPSRTVRYIERLGLSVSRVARHTSSRAMRPVSFLEHDVSACLACGEPWPLRPLRFEREAPFVSARWLCPSCSSFPPDVRVGLTRGDALRRALVRVLVGGAFVATMVALATIPVILIAAASGRHLAHASRWTALAAVSVGLAWAFLRLARIQGRGLPRMWIGHLVQGWRDEAPKQEFALSCSCGWEGRSAHEKGMSLQAAHFRSHVTVEAAEPLEGRLGDTDVPPQPFDVSMLALPLTLHTYRGFPRMRALANWGEALFLGLLATLASFGYHIWILAPGMLFFAWPVLDQLARSATLTDEGLEVRTRFGRRKHLGYADITHIHQRPDLIEKNSVVVLTVFGLTPAPVLIRMTSRLPGFEVLLAVLRLRAPSASSAPPPDFWERQLLANRDAPTGAGSMAP